MNGFLAHLAGIALGAPAKGAARPSLPPRYAHPHEGDAAPEAGQIEKAPGGPPPIPSSASDQQPSDHRPRSEARASDTVPLRTAARAERRPPRDSRDPAAPDTGRPPDALRPAPSPQMEHAEPALPPSGPTAELRLASPARHPLRHVAGEPLPPPASAMALPGRIGPADSGPIALPRRTAPLSDSAMALPGIGPVDAGPIASLRRTAPLSDAALAARIAPPPQADPVIHVTIDRIDVRAPASSRPAAGTRRPPAEPGMSLTDFLRGSGPRTRR